MFRAQVNSKNPETILRVLIELKESLEKKNSSKHSLQYHCPSFYFNPENLSRCILRVSENIRIIKLSFNSSVKKKKNEYR